MRKFLRIALALSLVMLFSSGTAVYAQKFGFIDTGELIESMPEMDTVKLKLETLNKDIQDTYESMSVEFNNKVNDYTKVAETLSEAIRKVKEDELQKLRERIEQFEATAPEEIRAEQNRLMAPVFTKAREAIEKVGKTKGLTAVFDLSAGALIYHDEATMTNILEDVRGELGIKKK